MGLSLQSGFILPSTRPSEKSVAKDKFFTRMGILLQIFRRLLPLPEDKTDKLPMSPSLVTSLSFHWGCGPSRVKVLLGCLKGGSSPTPHLRQTPVLTWTLKLKAKDPEDWLTKPHSHPRVSLLLGPSYSPHSCFMASGNLFSLPCKLGSAF